MVEMKDESEPDPTAFDAIVDKMKKELNGAESGAASTAHVSQLRAIFDAALHEMAAKGGSAAGRIHDEAEKMRTQMASHPAITVSSAFAVGYFIGKAIAGKARK